MRQLPRGLREHAPRPRDWRGRLARLLTVNGEATGEDPPVASLPVAVLRLGRSPWRRGVRGAGARCQPGHRPPADGRPGEGPLLRGPAGRDTVGLRGAGQGRLFGRADEAVELGHGEVSVEIVRRGRALGAVEVSFQMPPAAAT